MSEETEITDEQQDIVAACFHLCGRMGASESQIRYSDDAFPTVWIVVTAFEHKKGMLYLTEAAFTPDDAAFKAVEKLADGGQCTHCGKTTGVTRSFDPMPLDIMICWYQYDPELKKFRRSCE